MKRSELLDAIEDAVSNISMTTSAAEDANCIVSIVEAKLSPAWEPEVPEVLWEVPNTPGGWHAFQILSDGSVRSCGPYDAGEWRRHTEPLHPIHAELVRRLLEERKQQQALDEHNDKLEAESADRAIWSTLNEHQDRLAALEEWRGAANDLPTGVDAQREAFSRWVQVDREVYDRLLAVWRLWGPEGELRTKLTGVDFSGMQYGGGYLQQLRSELLALPDEVKP